MRGAKAVAAALRRRVRRFSVLALMAVASVNPTPALAGEQPEITSVYFAPGSATVNGYAEASTVVQYKVQHCGAGTIYLVAGIKPNAMTLDSRYWYNGKLRNIPPHMLVVQAKEMWVKGKALYGAHSARFGGLIPTSDKTNCFIHGMVLPSAPKGVKGDDFARTFGIFFDHSTTVLRNIPFEKFQEQLDKAEREQEAARKEAERKAEAERREAEKKQKDEQARQAAEEKRKQEEERRAAAQKQQAAGQPGASSPGGRASSSGGNAGTAGAGVTGAGAAGNYADGDFWGTGGTASGSASCDTAATQYVKSGNRYFRKDCKGQLQEVNMDDYYRHQIAQARQQKAEQRQQREQAAGAALQRMQEQQRLQEAQNARLSAELDARMAGLNSAYAAGTRLEEARSNIRDLTSLQQSYDSLESLDADFENRMGQLNSEFDSMREASRDKIDAGVGAIYGSEYQAYGEATGMIAKMAADRSIAKEEAAARAAMQRQREQMQADIVARRKAKQLALRQELLTTFADAPVPLSSQRVDADTIYFFSYTYTPGAVTQDHPALTVTNVFPVGRRSDGSWPFKRSLNEELRKVVSGEMAWAGFYTSAADADRQRQQFLDFARKGGFSITEVEYKGRAPTPGQASSAGQFWSDSGGGAGSSSGTGRSDDAFWGQPSKSSTGRTAGEPGTANKGFW